VTVTATVTVTVTGNCPLIIPAPFPLKLCWFEMYLFVRIVESRNQYKFNVMLRLSGKFIILLKKGEKVHEISTKNW
jgi:hypothetical protein